MSRNNCRMRSDCLWLPLLLKFGGGASFRRRSGPSIPKGRGREQAGVLSPSYPRWRRGWAIRTFGMQIMKSAKTVLFHFLSVLLSAALTVAVLLVGLKFFDFFLLSHRQAASPDEDADEPTMRTMEYYPFTGGQIQAYKRERG